MTDTSKREELIEALAAGVHECDGWMSDAQNARLEWDGPNRVIHFCGQGSIDVGHLAAIALAVFEQAHTSTDDEREALEDVIWGALEPRLEDVINLDLNVPAENAVFAILVGQVVDAVAAGFRRTVQGEPTDAQVLAALNAWYAKEREQNGWPIGSNAAELADYSPQTQDRMRAALRAAYEEGKKR